MNKNEKPNKEVFWHVIFWLFYLSYKISFENIRITISTDSVDTFFIHLIHIANFYFILYLLTQFFHKKKLLFFLLLLVGYVCYIPLLYFYCKVGIQSIGHGLYYSHLSWIDAVIDGTDFYFQFLFYAIGFWFVSQTYKSQTKLLFSEKENLVLKSDNLQLQNEKLIAEYNYLKTQINPHFLYNTLNYFYAETLGTSPRAAEGIHMLSGIMRYSLKNTDADGKMPLLYEVENLRNYLELQRIRFGDDLYLEFHLPENIPPDYRILPHLLLTLAENAFKHGDHCEPVCITLSLKNMELEYMVSNTILNSDSTSKIGVGLRNMTERLKQTYHNQFHFSYGKNDGIFRAILKISDIPCTKNEDAHTGKKIIQS
jgi:two-component system, LytTR family, sensor kinase